MSFYRVSLLGMLLAAVATITGCPLDDGRWVELQGTRYSVELALDDATRSRGLMFREEMPEDHGMLFVHETEMPLAYWMKNTRIPLDILYFDAQRRLVSQRRDVPPCSMGDRCPPHPSAAPAKYVLELNAGQAAKIGLKDGAVLTFGPAVPADSR
jgi:uncharacterized protein